MCSDGFHVYFTRFINISFLLGQFPSEWKLANVIPIFKNDNRQLKVNYCPVSLLASSSKICESGFLYKLQSGFRPGNSAINQLMFFVQ